MEDLITLVIAIAVGLASMLAGQRNKNKRPAPRPQSEEYDEVPPDLLERELDGPQTSTSPAQPTPLDILGRILTGDMGVLTEKPKPPARGTEGEFMDPIREKRRLQARMEAEKRDHLERENIRNKREKPPEKSVLVDFKKPEALRQAIVMSEVLDQPLAIRRRKKAG